MIHKSQILLRNLHTSPSHISCVMLMTLGSYVAIIIVYHQLSSIYKTLRCSKDFKAGLSSARLMHKLLGRLSSLFFYCSQHCHTYIDRNLNLIQTIL